MTAMMFVATCVGFSPPATTAAITDLRVDYLDSPLGVERTPRFTWRLHHAARGVALQSWRLRVSADDTFAATSLRWDSGPVGGATPR